VINSVRLPALIFLSVLAVNAALAGVPVTPTGTRSATLHAAPLLLLVAGITEEQLKELEELMKKKLARTITPEEIKRLDELKEIRNKDKGQTSDEDDC